MLKKKVDRINSSVGIRSLGVSFPTTKRTRDYYKEKYPSAIASAEHKDLAKLFSLAGSTPSNEFELEMLPYLKDPFRGTVEQRIVSEDESAQMLEYRAAKDALSGALLEPKEVDLMIVASVWPDRIGFGNATFLARELGLQGAAWNLDASSGSTPVALENACAMVLAGEYDRVLVVVSCTYSRFFDEEDTLSWGVGDGAGAFVVSVLEESQGILGTKTVHAAALCDVIVAKITQNDRTNSWFYMQMCENGDKAFRSSAATLLSTCCDGALTAAGVTLEQIDFFLFHTVTAWFASFCTRVLGIDPKRTLNLYPQYANMGPAITVTNLYYAAQQGLIRENDLVLVYAFGPAGTASANVMRWGKVALGSGSLEQLTLQDKAVN